MNKENIAQIILNNYIALAKEMDPKLKTDEMELISYLEVLKQQVVTEIGRIENSKGKANEENVEKTDSLVPEQPEQEPKEELNQEYIEEMAEKLVKTGELRTLAPIPERYGEAIAKRAEELRKERGMQTPTVPSPPTPMPKPTQTPIPPRLVTVPTEPVTTETSEELNQEYIEEMARTLVETGELKTLAPIPERYGEAIAKRAEELYGAEKTAELDLNYIEEMANILAETGELVTFSPIPERYGEAIVKRAETIRREKQPKSSTDDLSTMFDSTEVLTETDSVIIKR